MFAIAEFSNQMVTVTTAETAPARDSSDHALITASAAGDKDAMRKLYARHHVRVYRFIVRLTKDPSLAEDLVSETFLGAWRQARRFKCESQVSTWLLAIARNKTLSALSRRRDQHLDDDVANSIADPADNVETMIEARDRSVIIQKCLLQLSSDHREVIDLVYYHEKTIEEVAEIIQVPKNTVKTRMFYARQSMAKLLMASDYGLHSRGHDRFPGICVL